MEKLIICNKKELLKHKFNILELFELSFGSTLDEDVWHWAYIDNIFGDPVVSLYYENSLLVGHYAVIPYFLKSKEKLCRSVLSMTTMVHPDFRGRGFFTSQAQEVYKVCKEKNFDLVFGFPNKNSTPGFEKKLDWQVKKNYIICNGLTRQDLLNLEIRFSKLNFGFNFSSDNVISWRLRKPKMTYNISNGVILKKHNNSFDILYHEGEFSSLEDGVFYNIFLERDKIKNEINETFDYNFGYRIFNDEFDEITFNLSLILSDVF